jgi:hypothetical protein
MKWKVTRGENKGKPYQPGSFDKMMQHISYDWKAKGIGYNYKLDFNSEGEFHGVVIEHWNRIRKKDPKFGTCPNRARAPADILEIVIESIRSGTIKPYEDPLHLQMIVILIHGCMCGFRGQTEHTDLRMEQYTVGTFPSNEVEDLHGRVIKGVER